MGFRMAEKKHQELKKILTEIQLNKDKKVLYKYLLKIRIDHIKTREDIKCIVESGKIT